MDSYECPCGYVYDPEAGDPNNGIDAGTPFEDIPDDWVCPVCDAEKEFFELVEQQFYVRQTQKFTKFAGKDLYGLPVIDVFR